MNSLANCSFVADPHTEKILFMNIAQFQITRWQLHINTTNVCKKYFHIRVETGLRCLQI